MTSRMTLFTKDRLDAAFAALGATAPAEAFDQLAAAYGESGRHYHTADHINECLKALDEQRELAGRPAEVELAIWYHDAIYNGRRDDNEAASAELARQVLTAAGVDAAAVGRIAAMIEATATHDAADSDTALMLDIDLAILGQSAEVFAAYDEAIRQEFRWVPGPLYRRGRKKVLGGFLGREHIYVTTAFRDALESQARRNLSAALAELGG